MKRFVFILLAALGLSTIAAAQVKDVTSGVYSIGFFSTPNYVKNPSCFANVVNITASGGSLTRTTTTPVFGSASCLIDASSSAQTYKFATNTLDNGLNGQNCEARFTYTGDGSLYKAYVEQPAATKVSQELTLTNAGSGALAASIIYPCGSNSNATILTIEATSASAAAIRVGQAYVGQATGIGIVDPVSDWQTYTSGCSGSWSTNTTYSCKGRRVGDSFEAEVLVSTSGAPTAASLTVNLPTGYTIDTAKINSTSTHSLDQGTVISDSGTIYDARTFYNTATSVYVVSIPTGASFAASLGSISNVSPFTFGASDYVLLKFRVPISGWVSQSAVRADQTNYDWTSYTPTPTGFGTASSYECQHKRDGSDLLLRCKFTVGTSTATEARVSLPGSLTTDSVRVPSIQICGDAVRSAAAGSIQRYLTTCEASAAYVTFVLQSSGAGGLTKAQGSGIVGVGESWNFTARVPISGWIESQNAPILVGSVTSGTLGSERIERVKVTTSCTASPCTIADQSGSWVTNVTRSGTGTYAVNIVAGRFSSAPTCSCNPSTGNVFCSALSATTSAVTFNLRNTSSQADTDGAFGIICIGPR
jgi:hypothetical protein